MKCTTFLIIISLAAVNTAKLPSSFPKCSLKDKNLNECLKKSLQVVLPQLTKPFKESGLIPLEPLEANTMTISAGSGPVNVQQNYMNVKFYGLPKINLEKIDFNFEKKILFIEGRFPEIKMTSSYDFNGRILLLPMVGKGPSEIDLYDTTANLTLTFEEVQKKGKTHLNFLSNKIHVQPRRVTYSFENLFDGDKVLGDNINKVLNDNWQEVFEDVKVGYEEGIAQILLRLVNGLFAKVPISEVFDN